MKTKKQKCFLAIGMLLLTLSFAGCADLGQGEIADLDADEPGNRAEQGNDSMDFSVEDYQKQLAEDRVLISEYGDQYQKEVDVLPEAEYPNINFENCQFKDFPEAEKVEVLMGHDHGITVQESWDTIENWLKEIGKQDDIDMKKAVRVVSPKLGTDENDEYFLFYEHMSELDSGEGAFINEKECHIQIAADGIYSMSDGKITAYLESQGYESNAVGDALGNNTEDVIETGSLSELGNKKFDLLAGELTVKEGAELVKAYFEAGTPFPCETGVTLDIPEVHIFRLGEVYGYAYALRRVYNSVPFAYFQYGSRNGNEGDYMVDENRLEAYVVDDTGVSAFSGKNPCEKLSTLLSEDRMIGLGQMAELLSEKLAPQLKVQVKSVELVYVPINLDSWNNTEDEVILPCWQLTGHNKANGETIVVYGDVLTGAVYYYTCNIPE